MSAFTPAELEYLAAQPLMRFGSASPTGRPDVSPVGFEIDGDHILSGGFDITRTVRYRNVAENPRVNVVIDDLASIDPWTPRGVKVIGTATTESADRGERFRIVPEVIISWGINDPKPGIPEMERRSVG
jgi:pyridoxamine 5'-phosphate oxidase family protein